DFTRLYCRRYLAVGSDRQLMVQGFDRAFHLAIHVKIFAAENLADHLYGFADGGCASSTFWFKSGRGHTGHGWCLLPYIDDFVCRRRVCRRWCGRSIRRPLRFVVAFFIPHLAALLWSL